LLGALLIAPRGGRLAELFVELVVVLREARKEFVELMRAQAREPPCRVGRGTRDCTAPPGFDLEPRRVDALAADGPLQLERQRIEVPGITRQFRMPVPEQEFSQRGP
jgi:hypothetical protein